jgi:hypothetical protein
LKKNVKILYLFLVIAFPRIVLSQDIYKGNPWIIGFGGNLILEDRNQFENYLNNEKVYWNISPFTISLEKRLNKGFALQSIIGSNIYSKNQKINGTKLLELRDIVFVETYLKYNFNSIWQDTSRFDPFLSIGPGLIYRGKSGPDFHGSLGFGFNYWISKYYGISTSATYNFSDSYLKNEWQDDHLMINLVFLHIID